MVSEIVVVFSSSVEEFKTTIILMVINLFNILATKYSNTSGITINFTMTTKLVLQIHPQKQIVLLLSLPMPTLLILLLLLLVLLSLQLLLTLDRLIISKDFLISVLGRVLEYPL